jgi:hypothetical protein
MESWMMGMLIPIVAIIGGFTYVIIVTMVKARLRELEIRERIAMIEKGLMPPPEVDPRGFDGAMERFDRAMEMRDRIRVSTASGSVAARHRSAGIVLLGIGLGLVVLIGFSGAPDEGFAVGGFVAVLGLAFLINSLFERREPSYAPPANPSTSNAGGSLGGGTPTPRS